MSMASMHQKKKKKIPQRLKAVK
uniref:Uncharacterized protein n=1 Tax=Rhizophora mucronata TaxID=61149 RepID=A0A2P2QT43_RHIMU